MTLDTINIFVGCDPNNCDLEQLMVLEYSIRKHTHHPIKIHWMQLSHDPKSPWYSDPAQKKGWNTEKWATPFSGFRWAIPELCNFTGRAIYMDADVIVLSDISELWQHPIDDQAIVIAKGKKSARLCTCVWDCAKAQEFLPSLEKLRTEANSHQSMIQLIKQHPELVTDYQDSYNNIDGEDMPIEDIKILHYSDMGTQFSHKYSIPRLEQNNQKHWFDGEIMQHPRQDLIALFDQYYQEALNAGYSLENYAIEPFGEFKKATQKKYQGNKVTRPHEEPNWFKKQMKKVKSLFKKKSFGLDD